MNLGLGAEHEAVREPFRKLLDAAPPRAFLERPVDSFLDEGLWRRIAELGWLGTAMPEEHGGSGLDDLVLCVLAQEVGRSMAAVPFTASICGYAMGLKLSGHVASLPRLADGSAIGVLLTPDCWDDSPRLQPGPAGDWQLSGTAVNVLDGACATEALACVDGKLVKLDLAHARKLDVDARALDLLHPVATLQFDASPAHVLTAAADAEACWRDILDRYALFVAFEQLGGAEAALEMARSHSLSRYAFGRPIGAFQAIKHLLADLLVSVDLARSNCLFGAAALSVGSDAVAEAAAVARISATEAFRACARANIQVHGALGVTWESDCQLYYRRAQALAGSPGSPRFWKERLIEILRERRAREPDGMPAQLARNAA